MFLECTELRVLFHFNSKHLQSNAQETYIDCLINKRHVFEFESKISTYCVH